MFNFKLNFVLFFVAILFSNCTDKTDTVIETTVEQDKENIENLFNDVITEAQALENGCAVQAFDAFLNLNQGSALNSNWAELLYNSLEAEAGITTYQTGKFDFASYVGTYTWNIGSQTISSTNSPTDKIVVEFPEDMGATANTIVATADYYTDEMVMYNSYQYWLPTSFFAAAQINNEECISAKLVSATYDNTSFQIPVTMELEIKLSPYVFEITATRTAAAEVTVVLKAKNNGEEKFSLVADLVYKNANYQTLNYFNDCESASGEFTFGDFKMPYTADFKTARSLFNPTSTQVNALFDADIFYKGSEIANLDYAKDAQGYTDLLIVYKDETSEDVETYYNDFLDRLELVVVEFTGAWPR
ncbi:MAG: hypothetical protein ACI976_002689 [Aureispira sp.]|jgi:hypothetical protein